MKIKDGFILKDIAGSFVVVPVGENLIDFKLMITLNDTGAFLWDKLLKETTKEELYAALLSEYSVDENTAKVDVDEFIATLTEKKVIEE